MTMARPKRCGSQCPDLDPATPFHRFPGDLLLSTARRFGEFGIDAALAEIIRKPVHGPFVRQHLAALREHFTPQLAAARENVAVPMVAHQRPRLIYGLYAPPDIQLVNVRKWNVRHKWGIPEAWFTNLGPVPEWPKDRLACVTLEVALPDQPEKKDAQGVTIPAIPGYIRTVCGFWGIISAQHPNHRKYEQLLLDEEHLLLLDEATYKPGLRWRVLDLGANWDKTNGIVPATVRNPLTSPNVDGFAALAHHPRFVRRMDGVKVPYLWIAGFRVMVPGDGTPRRVPIVGWGRGARQVALYTYWDGHRSPCYSVPVRRGS
ncbi:MAG: hypothetical protein V1723_01910 [Candidatus Uhrbacteria bacterium]